MWVCIQQNSITKRMQKKSCSEGKVGQQNEQLEQSNHWVVLILIFCNSIPRHHLCVSKTVSEVLVGHRLFPICHVSHPR